MLQRFAATGALAILGLCLSLSGCGTPQAKLTYSPVPTDGYDGLGFPFVVPRTLVKVTPTADKAGATESVAFTSVPVAFAPDGVTSLPTFVATDSSSSGFALTPTTVTSVTYVDELIVSSVGTLVTDNRKELIDTIVTAASLAGAFASVKTYDCAKDDEPLKPFLIDNLTGPPTKSIPKVSCWRYKVEPFEAKVVGRRAHPVSELATSGTAEWFPIPACKAYKVTVFRCIDNKCDKPKENSLTYSTTISISDGNWYQRVPLPAKGKVSIHADFCGADSTNDSVGTSDIGLLKQLVSDVKAEKKK